MVYYFYTNKFLRTERQDLCKSTTYRRGDSTRVCDTLNFSKFLGRVGENVYRKTLANVFRFWNTRSHVRREERMDRYKSFGPLRERCRPEINSSREVATRERCGKIFHPSLPKRRAAKM